MSGFKFPWKEQINTNTAIPQHNNENDKAKDKQNNSDATPQLPLLFTPLKVKGLTLKNRISVSPMCQYSSEDGFLNDWHLVHLGGFAKGGAGLIHFEAASVSPNGRISPYDAGLWKDEQIAGFKRIVDFIHAHGAAAAFQIGHAGRKASVAPPFASHPHVIAPEDGGWTDTIAASSVAYPNMLTPKEMTEKEMKEVKEQFVATTKRALSAGFDWLEIHGAHGYLLNTFLSPLSNTRTDQYGGSFENRTRYMIEVTKAIREVWPDEKPLAVRLSCSDWVEGGWDINQTIQLSKLLKEVGVDLIDCSSGGISSAQQIPVGPLYQVPFSEQVKKNVADILVGAVGLIFTPQQAEEILQKGQADIVYFAREFLREPYWPIKAAAKFGIESSVAPQYARAYVNYVKHINDPR